MDVMIVLLWSLVFSMIVIVLGVLHYCHGRPNSNETISEKQNQYNSMKQQQQQSNRSSSSKNRRKHGRNANKKRQKLSVITNEKFKGTNDDESQQEKQLTLSEVKLEDDELPIKSSTQSENDDDEFQEAIEIQELLILSSQASIQEEQKPILLVEQPKTDETNHMNSQLSCSSSSYATSFASTSASSLHKELVFQSKPPVNGLPVKQVPSLNATTRTKSKQTSQVSNSRSNENSSVSYKNYSYCEHSSLPPRFRYHKQQKEITDSGNTFIKTATRPNNAELSTSKQQIDDKNLLELPSRSYQHKSSNHRLYSLESEILSVAKNCSNSLLSTSNVLLDKLITIFDTVSFSSDELELILNKLTTKQLLDKQDWQHLLSIKTKKNKTIEHIRDETSHHQAKIYAIELQREKNRVLELSKINNEMNKTIKQLQQSNDSMTSYQQTILSYQAQIRRLYEENAHLFDQLNVYSVMPNSINELKQQKHLLDEQIQQITVKNNTLEKEIADGKRAQKHAAEIYKKADSQKQERIEKMIFDLKKYKKIDTDLNLAREQFNELRQNLNLKLNDLIDQRDQLQMSCNQLEEKAQEYEQLQIKYDQLIRNQLPTSNFDQLQQELNDVKAKNDLLKQRHRKIIEQLNKQSHQQETSQTS